VTETAGTKGIVMIIGHAMRRLRAMGAIGSIAVLLSLGLTACGGSDPARPGSDGDAEWETYRSDLSRETEPQVAAGDLETLLQGNLEFTLALYQQLRASRGNLLFSPLSIRMAFAMVQAGARGETTDQIDRAMRYMLDQTRLHPAYNALDLELGRRNLPLGPEGEDPVELYLANAFWGRLGLLWRQSYLDLLAVNYGAETQGLDFASDPETARQVINAWVEERTRGRIEDLLPSGSLSTETAAVLTNAVYFKAPWDNRFSEALTVAEPFARLAGGPVSVPMMHQEARHRYGDGEDYQAVEISFRGRDLAMVFLLPRPGEYAAFAESLTPARLAEILASLYTAHVELALPRFSFISLFELKQPLRALGMDVPWTSGADLSGMVDGPRLFISKALHKTFINVNELGTEAAAATAIAIEIVSVLPERQFAAERPFLFLIRDRVTGSILFFGQVLDPLREG
jgi:serpin B